MENINIENLTLTKISNTGGGAFNNFIVIKDIKCGGEHTIVLSEQGRVYSFGHGYTGQLGQGNSKNFHLPMLVKSLIKKKVIHIAAGWSHSMILTSQNYLYITGCGKYGELGLEDDENRKSFTLVRSTMNLNITKIFAGGHHSWILVDSKHPEKVNIPEPSPLETGGNSPPSGNQSPRNFNLYTNNNENNKTLKSEKPHPMSNLDQKLRFDLDLLAGKFINKEKFLLQVAYTDLKICHRFIRFSIPQTSRFKDITYKDLNILFQNFFKNEKGIISYRLQDDNEINFKNRTGNNNIALDILTKEIKNNFKFNLNKKYFYSIVIVYDHSKNHDFITLKQNIEEIKLKENFNNYSYGKKDFNQSFCNNIYAYKFISELKIF